MKSAATMREDAQTMLRRLREQWDGEPDEDWTHIEMGTADFKGILRYVSKTLEAPAPPAAERTALKDLRKKVEALKEPYEWVEIGVSGARDYEHKYDVKTLNQVLAEIDAASASEGTKSE